MGSLDADVLKANAASSPANPLDPEEFRRQAHVTVDFLADYYRDVGSYPVRSQVEPGDVRDLIVPGITHWQSPSFFAYFQCCGSTAGFLGEMLSTGFNVVGFNWVSSPAATELESIVMDWLGSTLALPKPFLFSGGGGGVLQGPRARPSSARSPPPGSDAVQDRKGRHREARRLRLRPDALRAAEGGPDRRHPPRELPRGEDVQGRPLRAVARGAAQGRGRRRGRGAGPLVPVRHGGHDAVGGGGPSPGLCAAAAEKGCGCTSTRRTRERVHLPRVPGFIDGVEGADSFSFNAHKWLFTTLDCCCLWVKSPDALVRALSTNPEYLRNRATESKSVVDYKDCRSR
uniref:Uncharacterized protein n=1 Tax=Ananas comosus var. bracteatus TaxID=296719 RepID=A0A6V7NRK4_ANACO|nr:unnamed protein product [Ananas comosus var. bracteatus]